MILFRQPPLWQEYRWHIVSVVGLICVQAALIVTLLVQRRRRREAQAVLAEGLRFETLVSEVIAACATATLGQLDERIRDGLQRVVMFLGVDRGSLWQRAENSAVLSLTHVWQRQDQPAPPVIADLQSFPYFRERAEAGHIMCFSSPDDFPPHASAERAGLRAAGVRSFAAIPLFDGDRLLGFLVFLSLHAERRWHAHVVQQLQTLAEPFSTALIRVRSAAVVESSVATAGAVLAALPGETAIIDSAGTIVQTNEAWATAARSGAAAQFALKVGANYVEACRNAIGMPPDIARKVHASIEAVLRGERDEFTVEYPTSRLGEDRWFEVRVRRLARLGGGAAVMHFDVTARRQAEASARRHLSQIAHLDRVASMGQLASSLAHELNQPLTAVLINAQAAKRLLARSQPDLGELRACLADIISDDQRAGEVILRMRRLLTKTDVVSMPLALNALVADTIGLVANEALLHAVTIEFSSAPALPIAYGDIIQIQQVILNLLTNAIAAAANGGAPARKVTVWTSVAGAPYVEVGVHDSGKGIAEVPSPRASLARFAACRQMALGRSRVQDAKPGRRGVRRGQSGRQRRGGQAGASGPRRRSRPGDVAARPPSHPQGRRGRRPARLGRDRESALRRSDAARAAASAPGAAAVAGARRRSSHQAAAARHPAAEGTLMRIVRGGSCSEPRITAL